ncbi:MAG: h [Pedosphaera sp.]|nr:h [Pedosphaera sp.]
MKLKQLVIIALAIGIPAWSTIAQDGPKRPNRKGPPPSENGGPQGGSQDGQGGPGSEEKGHRPPPPIIATLDANHDGVISADEIANAATALKSLDKNGDGQLTADELRPQAPPPGAPQGGQPPHEPPTNADGNHPQRPVPPLIAALDANSNGTISADEIANAAASLLKLDKNNDGKLSREELRPEPPPQ